MHHITCCFVRCLQAEEWSNTLPLQDTVVDGTYATTWNALDCELVLLAKKSNGGWLGSLSA